MHSLQFYFYRRGFSIQSPQRAATETTRSDVADNLQIKRNNVSLEVQRHQNNSTISTNKTPTERKSLWVKKFQQKLLCSEEEACGAHLVQVVLDVQDILWKQLYQLLSKEFFLVDDC